MGQPYTSIVGNPPHLGSGEIRTWCENLINARHAYCSQPRAITYYVASGAPFGNTGLTTADPIPFNKIPSLLTSDRAFLFKRGDEFNFASGILSPASLTNVTFGDYGNSSDPNPLISAFILKYPSGTNWTSLGGDLYCISGIAPSAPISWIREYPSDQLRLSPYRYRSTMAGVVAGNRTFTYAAGSGGTVFVNVSGVSPSNRNFEMVMDNSLCAFEVNGDGSLVANLDVHGFGCNTSAGALTYGIISRASGNAAVSISGCKVYYAGRHNFAQLTASQGGYVLISHCKAGYPNDQARDGYSHWVGYCNSGEHEFILNSCETDFGALPDDVNLPGSGDSYLQAGLTTKNGNIYGHTATGSGALFLVYNCQTTAPSGFQGPLLLMVFVFSLFRIPQE